MPNFVCQRQCVRDKMQVSQPRTLHGQVNAWSCHSKCVVHEVMNCIANLKASPQNEISDHISDDIPPQMNILNVVIPILMHFFHIHSPKASYFASNLSFASSVKPLRQPIKNDVTYDVGVPTVYHGIYKRKFLT